MLGGMLNAVGNSSSGSNQFMMGGLVLIVVQSFSRLLEQTGRYIATYIFRLFFVTVNVDNTQDAHTWITTYLSKLHEEGKVTTWGTLSVLNNLSARKISSGYNSLKTEGPQSSKNKSNVFFVPGAGVHFIRVSWWRWLIVHNSISEISGTGYGTATTREVLWLGTIGVSESFFRDFIEKARKYSFLHDHDSTIIYVQDRFRRTWERAVSKTKRDWNSVILDEDIAENVYQDCVDFLNAKEWYSRLGVPYSRRFLLESKPGCGKSSFIQALAGRLEFDIAYLSLVENNLDDATLAAQLRCTPPDSIIVLEEFDVAFPNRTKRKTKEKQEKTTNNPGLTLSGLLNCLDGLIACEGKIIFFTTNHLEHLDPALVRPGRVDLIVSIRLASHVQIQKLFLRFYPGKDDIARLYANCFPEYEFSMAQIQCHLLRFRDAPLKAVSDIPNYLTEIHANQKRHDVYEAKLNQVGGDMENKSDESDDVVPI